MDYFLHTKPCLALNTTSEIMLELTVLIYILWCKCNGEMPIIQSTKRSRKAEGAERKRDANAHDFHLVQSPMK